jgi:predicted Zn finger-like uncharacterized protein
MAIKIKCGKCEARFSVKDAAAGRRVKCRECGVPIKVPVPKTDEEELLDFDAAAFGDEPSGDDPYGDEASTGTQPLPRRRKKKSSKPGKLEPAPLVTPLRLCIAAGIVAVICIAVAMLARSVIPPTVREILLSVGFLAGNVIYDQYCRHRIKSEIEGFGGRTRRVSWRPFQGGFFSRGWKAGCGYRFYAVNYLEGSREKSELCGVHLIFGNRWDWD